MMLDALISRMADIPGIIIFGDEELTQLYDATNLTFWISARTSLPERSSLEMRSTISPAGGAFELCVRGLSSVGRRSLYPLFMVKLVTDTVGDGWMKMKDEGERLNSYFRNKWTSLTVTK